MEGLVNPSPEFWHGRRVLLTGHTGFKGAWLALWLRRLGAEVTGLALEPPTTPSLFSLACNSADVLRDCRGDIRDLERVLAIARAARPEVVLHLAAQSLVRPSYDDPVGTYASNVMGTVHVLEALRQVAGVKAAVIVTSDKCYQNREWLWAYRESEPMGGHDPYSSSKGCAELVTSAYRDAFFRHSAQPVALASGRAGNVIGGGDWAVDRILPDCVRAFAQRQAAVVRNPGAIRPWQHVLEPLCGYLLLAERLHEDGPSFGEAWNFGPAEEDARPVSYLVDRVAKLWGDGAAWHTTPAQQPHEATYLKVDASKARARLAWRPRLNVDAALDWTVEWYRRQLAGEDAMALCLEQIARFQDTRSA